MKPTEAKERLKAFESKFIQFYGVPMTCTFDGFSFPIIMERLELGRIGDMRNKPESREVDGKNKRPAIAVLHTNAGIFRFAIEDMEVTYIMEGIQIDLGAVTFQFRKV